MEGSELNRVGRRRVATECANWEERKKKKEGEKRNNKAANVLDGCGE
jgi:hypothetical protein